MEKNEYSANLSKNWEIISLDDFMENLEVQVSYRKWLKEQEFDKESGYLEISVKILPR